MTKILLGTTALVALMFAGAAQAADLARKAPPPVVDFYNWTGFYVGGQIGYIKVDDDFSDPEVPIRGSVSADGFIGGGHVGYNFQAGRVVYGIEGDVEWSGASGSGTGFNIVGDPRVTGHADLNWQASLRARLGVAAFDRALLYATGGVAWGDFDFGYTFPIVGGITDSFSKTLTGWTAGAGVETALWGNWTGRIEYRFTDYGSATGSIANCCAPPPNHQRHELESHSFRAGLSYRFGGPLVARY